MSPYLLIGLSVVMSVLGQVAMKYGIGLAAPAEGVTAGALQTLLAAARSPFVFAGLAFYGLGAAAWIVVLSKLDLSYAYPFIALNFVLITLVSRAVFSEAIPSVRWVGIALICVGIVLIARGQPAS